ncbi:GerAB/ArcD/ProY family transporter [Paenibacillus sp. SYP-B3998]|uniref:GerAB/ArcD/ProY family transporter n=1 Tax=Paenibacillus sp. SYP-B3998 TaxID=2678564 RepID=A0A6G3ZU44_9BACL|nr:GerAB/ArcD/ProY family transporter [Paenibacillus sp. SYP-B3998]NEW05736.1 GerAB/ArcD/ProY family transporter [Paenibacillus sp. SYP-B3998]
MKNYAMNGITLMQYIFLIHGAQVGTGVLSLPREIAETSGTDGWMCILIAWAINCLAGWIILLTLQKYPDYTLPDLLNHLFGKWFGKLLLAPFIAYFAFFGWLIMVNSMLYIKAWFLVKTPGYILLILVAVPSYLVINKGFRVQARYVEFITYTMMWMPFFLLIPLGKGHWLHLLPLFKEGWQPILNGLPQTFFSFAGIEILFFLYPFLQKKQYALRGFLIANTLTMILYTYVTIISFVFYTPDGITLLNQPVLSLLKTIEFRFLERFDMFFLAIYLFVVSRAWIPYIYCTVFSACHILNKPHYKSYTALYFIVAIGCVYVINPTWNQSDKWQMKISYMGMGVLYVLPIVMYMYVRGVELFQRRKVG